MKHAFKPILYPTFTTILILFSCVLVAQTSVEVKKSYKVTYGLVVFSDYQRISLTDQPNDNVNPRNIGGLGGGIGFRTLIPFKKSAETERAPGFEVTLAYSYNKFSEANADEIVEVIDSRIRILPIINFDLERAFFALGLDGGYNFMEEAELEGTPFNFRNKFNLQGLGRLGIYPGQKRKFFIYGMLSYQLLPNREEVVQGDLQLGWDPFSFGLGLGTWLNR